MVAAGTGTLACVIGGAVVMTIAEVAMLAEAGTAAMTGVGGEVMINSGGSTGTGGSVMISNGGRDGWVTAVMACSFAVTSSSADTGPTELVGATGVGGRFDAGGAAAEARGFRVVATGGSASLAALVVLVNPAVFDWSKKLAAIELVGLVPNAFPGFAWISCGGSCRACGVLAV